MKVHYVESNAPSSQLNNTKTSMPGCILKKKLFLEYCNTYKNIKFDNCELCQSR